MFMKISESSFKVTQEVVRIVVVASLLYLIYITVLCPCEMMFSCHAIQIYVVLIFVLLFVFTNLRIIPWQVQ